MRSRVKIKVQAFSCQKPSLWLKHQLDRPIMGLFLGGKLTQISKKFTGLPFQTDNLCEENTAYYGNNYVCGYKNRKDSILDCQKGCASNANWNFGHFVNQGSASWKPKGKMLQKDTNFTYRAKNCHLPDKGTGLSPGRDTPISLDLLY